MLLNENENKWMLEELKLVKDNWNLSCLFLCFYCVCVCVWSILNELTNIDGNIEVKWKVPNSYTMLQLKIYQAIQSITLRMKWDNNHQFQNEWHLTESTATMKKKQY